MNRRGLFDYISKYLTFWTFLSFMIIAMLMLVSELLRWIWE